MSDDLRRLCRVLEKLLEPDLLDQIEQLPVGSSAHRFVKREDVGKWDQSNGVIDEFVFQIVDRDLFEVAHWLLFVWLFELSKKLEDKVKNEKDLEIPIEKVGFVLDYTIGGPSVGGKEGVYEEGHKEDKLLEYDVEPLEATVLFYHQPLVEGLL